MKPKLLFLALIVALSASTASALAQLKNPTLDQYLAEKAIEHADMLRDLQQRFEAEETDRVLDSIAADRDSATRMRLERFIADVFMFTEQIERLVPLYDVPISEPGARESIETLSGELDDSISRFRNFVNYGTQPPQINVSPLPEESAAVRILRLVDLSRRLIPNIISLAGADTFELDLLDQVRDDLAIAEALSLALPHSAF